MLNTWPFIRPDAEHLAIYKAEYWPPGHLSGRILTTWPFIRPNAEHLAIYQDEYWPPGHLSGRILKLVSGQIYRISKGRYWFRYRIQKAGYPVEKENERDVSIQGEMDRYMDWESFSYIIHLHNIQSKKDSITYVETARMRKRDRERERKGKRECVCVWERAHEEIVCRWHTASLQSPEQEIFDFRNSRNNS